MTYLLDPSTTSSEVSSTATKRLKMSNGSSNKKVPDVNGNYHMAETQTLITKKPSTRIPSKVSSRNCRQLIRPFLPSTYLKRFIPPTLYRFACYGCYAFWFMIGILVLRKTKTATDAVRYIKTHGHTVSLEVNC